MAEVMPVTASAAATRTGHVINGHVEYMEPTIVTNPHNAINDKNTPPLLTVTDLINQRATEAGAKDEPIVLYPQRNGQYTGYTPAQLDAHAHAAAEHYSQFVPRRVRSDDAVQVVGLLGVSTFEYLITLLALTRLGHTVLFLSTRIAVEAYVSLIEGTGATSLFVDDGFVAMGEKIQARVPGLKVRKIASTAEYEGLVTSHPVATRLDPERETHNVAWIIHSSGSTNLPKPVYITHRAALMNYTSQFSLVGYITLPLFHAHGLSCTFRAIMMRKQIYLYDATAPLTSGRLIKTMREHPDIGVLYGVPYALKLLAESEEGIRLLAKLEVVMFGGSACPKPIGDLLVKAGVMLVSHYGSTETGQLMTSFRERDDLDWDFVRPSDALRPFLQFEPYAPGIFELVVLDGWFSKVATNREDGSYATKDLFEKHPDKEAFRYFARKDDTIVLVNGEKANPLLHEGAAKQMAMVEEAVVFGAQRPYLGMFVIPASPQFDRESIVEAVWPAVEEANKVVPAYAQVSKEMIRLLPADIEYRRTDKGTVIRAAFYKQFADLVESAYAEGESQGTLILDEEGLREYLRNDLQEKLRLASPEILSYDTDIFSLGIDSLLASQIRSKIAKDIDIGKRKLGQNFAFDFPSINAMARELLRMRIGGEATEKLPVEQRMDAMIQKYSDFKRGNPVDTNKPASVVLVTGATGSLGAHLVASLVSRVDVSTVVCLVRAASREQAMRRVQKSLDERRISLADEFQGKIVAYASNLADEKLGLEADVYEAIASGLASIIHCAWSVNFNMGLESFEGDCVAGTKHLLDLCLSARHSQPASFNFCSSVSAVAGSPGPLVPEELPSSLSFAQNMGYAQSKLVTEHICLNAAKATGMNVKILRTGQIIGDTRHGIWNTQEAIPMIFRCAETIGVLPRLDETPSWLPVDVVAEGLAQLSLTSGAPVGVYHVVNNTTFSWTADLLAALEAAGLEFEGVSQQEWLRRLRSLPDPVMNPPFKLMSFFESKYERSTPRKQLTYLSEKARAASPALASAPALNQDTVDKFVRYFERIWASEASS